MKESNKQEDRKGWNWEEKKGTWTKIVFETAK